MQYHLIFSVVHGIIDLEKDKEVRSVVTSFSEFIDYLIGARFSFTYVWELLVSVYTSIASNSDVLSIWDGIMNFLNPVSTAIPYIIMAFGLIVALFGKKMGGVLKFLGFFVIGFFIGVHFLAPVIPAEVPIPIWVTGIVVAIVVAVLSKFVFVITASVTVLYSVYRLCYHGFFLDHQWEFSSGKAITALVVAVIILILTIVLFRFVEMLLFSALGGFMITSGFALGIIDLGAIPKLGDNSWILEVSVIGVVTLLGFIFQFKTRRRY